MKPILTLTNPLKPHLAVHVVLDRSGSMASMWDDAIGAFNVYVSALKKETPGAILSLTLFDTQSVDTTILHRPIAKVPDLTRETFVPRGGTPLYDAIGRVIPMLDGAEAERKALVILTDGAENASSEFRREAIKALIDDREKQGWLIIYLGANQDAFAEGGAFGSKFASTMTFDQRSVGSSMTAAARSTASYAAAASVNLGKQAATFTEAERSAAWDPSELGIAAKE